MSEIDAKLRTMGLTLPAPAKLPPGVVVPFSVTEQQGYQAARLAGLAILASL